MKKLLFVLIVLLAFTACQRPRVRHDRKARTQHVRLPVDTMQKDDVEKVDKSWADEDLIVLPEEPKNGKAAKDLDEKIERMMRGEEVDLDE